MRPLLAILLFSSLAHAQSADELFEQAYGLRDDNPNVLWRAVEADPRHAESWIALSRVGDCADKRTDVCNQIHATLVKIGCRDCLIAVASQRSLEDYLALVRDTDQWKRSKRLRDALTKLRSVAKRLDTAPAAEIADLPIGLRTKAATKNAKTLGPYFADKVRGSAGVAQPRATRITDLLGQEGNPPLIVGEPIVCDDACCLLRATDPHIDGARVPSVLCFDAKNRVDTYVEASDDDECPRWMVPGNRVFVEPLPESTAAHREVSGMPAARRAIAADPSDLGAWLALYRALPPGAERDGVRQRIATVDSVEARQLFVDEAKSFVDLAERQPRHDCRSHAYGGARMLSKILHHPTGPLTGFTMVTARGNPVELRNDPTGRTRVTSQEMPAWWEALAKLHVAVSPAMFCPASPAPVGLYDPPLNHCCRMLYPSSAPPGPRITQVCVDGGGLTRIDF
jgi:hypothetical protein